MHCYAHQKLYLKPPNTYVRLSTVDAQLLFPWYSNTLERFHWTKRFVDAVKIDITQLQLVPTNYDQAL